MGRVSRSITSATIIYEPKSNELIGEHLRSSRSSKTFWNAMKHESYKERAVGFCGPVNSLPWLMMKQPMTLLNTRRDRLIPNAVLNAHFCISFADMLTHFLDFSFSKKHSPLQSQFSTTSPQPEENENEIFPSLLSRCSSFLIHAKELLPSSRLPRRQSSGCAVRSSHAWFLPCCKIDISSSSSSSSSSYTSSSTSSYRYDHEHQHQSDHNYL